MSEAILSIGAARALHLAAQGMLQARRGRAGARPAKADALAAIRRMGVLQIDTISVVARSPYLVRWSRLGDYDPAWLDAGWRDPVFVHPDHADLLDRAAAGTLVPGLASLLSPFDPIVWGRRRALELFGFDYRLECYTPAAQRRYGYFTLPILRRGALVGRVDAKAQRKAGVFELRMLTLEPGLRLSAPGRGYRRGGGALRALASLSAGGAGAGQSGSLRPLAAGCAGAAGGRAGIGSSLSSRRGGGGHRLTCT